jgi:hemerythrin-like domain-containing protein
MSKIPDLLNDDGSASMATMLMMSHHAFRRDLARFATALGEVAKGDASRVEALREEWQNYRGALHGHHEMEDTHVFPSLASVHTSLRETIAGLTADHRRIDPLLERGDRAFAELPKAEAAVAVITELQALLDPHLTREEAEVAPALRGAKEFPAPGNDDEAALYANGFAWSMNGIAPEVLERVQAMLPAALTVRLPAARAAFAARCERVWGSARAGAARTPIPEGY